MDFRQLRCFLAVAEELHFTRAARRLGMAQPPLSQQIHRLEEELGVALFNRRKRRSVELTAAGHALLKQVKPIMAQIEHVPAIVRRADAGESGHISIGFVGSATYGFLPTVLRAFRKLAPAVELELTDMDMPRQLDALSGRRMQLGFVRMTPRAVEERAGLQCESVQDGPFVAALPVGHPLTRAPGASLPLSKLANEPFLMYGDRTFSTMNEMLIDRCVAAGFRPREVQHVNEMQTLLALVGAGLGVALVPQSAEYLKWSGVVLRPLTAPVPRMDLLMVWHREETSPAAQLFMRTVRACRSDEPKGRTC
jgi:DNA-binding transcriptional LysR family regulator